MVTSLRTRNGGWRAGFIAGLCAFAIAQTILLAHTADASRHHDDAPCRICLAIAHAGPAPTPATSPVGGIAFCIGLRVPAIAAPALPQVFSPHAPRAPPHSL